jgi:FkbM family methyltransferase
MLRFGRLRLASAENGSVWAFLPFYATFFQDAYACLEIGQNDTVLDAGANIGFFSIYAAPRCRKVIAVEPNQKSFTALTLNKRLNRASNIITVNKALWNSSGYVRMAGDGVFFRVIPPGDIETGKSLYVPCSTIDQLVAELDCSVDVVKMDVEGAERACADGSYLRSVREIVVETHGTSEYIHGLLRRRGFSTRVVTLKYGLIMRNLLRHLPAFSEAEISTKLIVTRWSLMAMVRRQAIMTQRGNPDVDIIYGHKT